MAKCILGVRFEVQSMHLASLYREPVMTVNIPAQERNATCRIVASLGSSMCWYVSPLKTIHFDGGVAMVATL